MTAEDNPFAAAGVGIAVAAVVMFSAALLNDGDTYWHLATGDWMLRHASIVRADPFSFSVPGRAWTAHEWLAEVLMAAARRIGGWGGVMALFGAACGATAFIAARFLQRRVSPMAMVLFLALMGGVMAPSLLARPHVLAWPVMTAWVVMLIRAREQGRAPHLAWLLLMVFWANLHGSFVLGLALIAPFALEALLENRDTPWPVARAWGLFGAGAVVAAMLSPHGPAGLIFPFQLMGLASAPGIDEWRPADFAKVGPFELALLAVLYLCLSRPVRVPLLRLIVLLGLLHMGLQHARHQAVLALVGGLILAEAVGLCLFQDRRGAPPVAIGARLGAGLAVATAACAILLLALRAVVPAGPTDRLSTPVAALAHVPAPVRSTPVLNEYGFGGYLIDNGVRPFIDGRADMYGDAFIARYDAIVRPDPVALDAALRRYDIQWTFLDPANGAVPLMDHRPGWRRVWTDRYAVVHVKDALR